MQLYFSPLACSLATRIALYEAGAAPTFTEVDLKTKRTRDGEDYLAVHPLGLVPVLRTDAGELLSENAAVLQYVADRHPAAGLAPAGGLERARLQEWLSFVGTELHKALFFNLLGSEVPDAVKAHALERAQPRLAHVDRHLTGREFLLERFSVADAYLFTTLVWTAVTPVELARWPGLAAFFVRVRARPAVARALREEQVLYAEQQARRAAA